MRSLRCETGLTLVELLIGLAIFGLLLIGIYSLYLGGANIWLKGILRMDNQQNACIAMDFLLEELRYAEGVQIIAPCKIKFWFKNDPGTYIIRQAGEEIVFERKNGSPSHNKIAQGIAILDFQPDPGGTIRVTIRSGTGNEQVTLSSGIYPRNLPRW